MSKSSSKKNRQEETAPSASTGADSADVEERESAVEELDEALDALPGGGDADSDSDDESGANPLAQVDVSGETSFESAEFEAGEGADGGEPDEDGSEAERSDEESDEESDDDDDDDTADFVVHDADAEDRAEEFERMSAEMRSQAEPAQPDDDIAPGGQPRELAELVNICEALIFVSEDPITTKALADILGEDKGWVQVAV